jgi:hypothetical protein
MPIQESVMRRVRLNLLRPGLIPLAFVLLEGCAAHLLRCDAHLTPINPPDPAAVPGAMPPDVKPSDGGSP